MFELILDIEPGKDVEFLKKKTSNNTIMGPLAYHYIFCARYSHIHIRTFLQIKMLCAKWSKSDQIGTIFKTRESTKYTLNIKKYGGQMDRQAFIISEIHSESIHILRVLLGIIHIRTNLIYILTVEAV